VQLGTADMRELIQTGLGSVQGWFGKLLHRE
jgi:hypothetical protein